MESYRSYQAEQQHEIESDHEADAEFEQETKIPVEELEQWSAKHRHGSNPNALWHSRSNTLIVPPQTTLDGDMTAGDLARMAVPVAEFITDTQPDIIIGCDRGGRLYTTAVHSYWNKINPGTRIPTLDSKVHFARLSKTVGPEMINDLIKDIYVKSVLQADITGKQINGDKVKILFIEDWIGSGETRDMIMDSFRQRRIDHMTDVNFAVMCGDGADASGGDLDKGVPWHDNPELTGVDYDGAIPRAVRTKASREIRKEIHTETQRLVDHENRTIKTRRSLAQAANSLLNYGDPQ